MKRETGLSCLHGKARFFVFVYSAGICRFRQFRRGNRAVRYGRGECGVISGAERRAVGGMAGLPPSGAVLSGGG